MRKSPQPPSPTPQRVRTAWRLLTTAALAAGCLVLAFLLWRTHQELRHAEPSFPIELEPAETHVEIRGGAGAETPSARRSGGPPDRQVFRPPRGHRVLLTLELPVGAQVGGDSGRIEWAAELVPPPGEGPGVVEPAAPVGRAAVRDATPQAVRVELEADPAPGPYRVNLYRFQGRRPERVARYGYRIGVPEDVPGDGSRINRPRRRSRPPG